MASRGKTNLFSWLTGAGSGGLEPLPPPQVDAARCVHNLVPEASCRRCAGSCPAQAWVIDDESLGIDVRRCDGCGICAAVCPQQALTLSHRPLVIAERAAAFAACQRAAPIGEPGAMPCLHGIDECELLGAYARGVRCIHVATGDCEHCPRHGARRFEAIVAAVDDVVTSHALPPFEVQYHAPAQWRERRDSARPAMSVQADRRRFLRAGIADTLERVIGEAGSDGSQVPAPLPGPPEWSPESIFLWAPEFNPRRCIACDACVRICPTRALGEEQARGVVTYSVKAESCTGCGLCRDVCQHDAIAVSRRSRVFRARLELVSRRCRGCGVEYRQVAGEGNEPGDDDGLCRVCRLTGRNRQLFQVIAE